MQKKCMYLEKVETYLSPNSLSPYNEYVLLVITDYISNQKSRFPKAIYLKNSLDNKSRLTITLRITTEPQS